MKNRKRVWIAVVCLCFFMLSDKLFAQNAKPDMQDMLQSKRYLFTAQYAQPLGGSQITLTSTYTLRISGDSLICHLPYYGRAYVSDGYPGGDGGLMFTSLHFDYSVRVGKHNRYTIAIKVNDLTNVQQIFINVSKNGYANLQAIPTNKQSISYYGTITALPERK